jgi:hypothetical protein
VPFLDARRGKENLPEHAQRNRGDRTEPRRQPCRHRSRHDGNRRNDEQRVAKEIVDGQPERRDHQHQRGELEPRLRGSAIICLGQCGAPVFSEALGLPTRHARA